MEAKLKSLFDYQRFEANGRLAALIADTESRYGCELFEDDLGLVNAAGDPAMKTEDRPVPFFW